MEFIMQYRDIIEAVGAILLAIGGVKFRQTYAVAMTLIDVVENINEKHSDIADKIKFEVHEKSTADMTRKTLDKMLDQKGFRHKKDVLQGVVGK